MGITALREKLHTLIENSSEDKLEEIYDSFQEVEYSEDFKAMLDDEFEQYQKDGDVFSNEEVNKLIGQLLHPKNSKCPIKSTFLKVHQKNRSACIVSGKKFTGSRELCFDCATNV
jgi:F0F1-type ATP synthase delta subunit